MTCIYYLRQRLSNLQAQEEYAKVKKFQSDAEELSKHLKNIGRSSQSYEDLGVEPFE